MRTTICRLTSTSLTHGALTLALEGDMYGAKIDGKVIERHSRQHRLLAAERLQSTLHG